MIKDVTIDGKNYFIEYEYDDKDNLVVLSINKIMNKGPKGYAIVEYERRE